MPQWGRQTNGQHSTCNWQLATEVAILLSTQNADAIKYLREAPVDDAHNDVVVDDDPMDGSLEVHIILI